MEQALGDVFYDQVVRKNLQRGSHLNGSGNMANDCRLQSNEVESLSVEHLKGKVSRIFPRAAWIKVLKK